MQWKKNFEIFGGFFFFIFSIYRLSILNFLDACIFLENRVENFARFLTARKNPRESPNICFSLISILLSVLFNYYYYYFLMRLGAECLLIL